MGSYPTRPWMRATGETADGPPVRFTASHSALCAIVLGQPTGAEVRLEVEPEAAGVTASIIGDDRRAEASYAARTLTVALSKANYIDGLTEQPDSATIRVEDDCNGRTQGTREIPP